MYYQYSARVRAVVFQDGNGPTRPVFGPGPMALRPILGVMGRPIFPRCCGLDGPLDIMGRPKYFSIIQTMYTINTFRKDKIQD